MITINVIKAAGEKLSALNFVIMSYILSTIIGIPKDPFMIKAVLLVYFLQIRLFITL